MTLYKPSSNFIFPLCDSTDEQLRNNFIISSNYVIESYEFKLVNFHFYEALGNVFQV